MMYADESPLARSYTTANKKIGNLLLELGIVDAQQFEKAIAAAETAHQRIEDAVIDLGMVTEPNLLKALATHHKSRFVSTEKLAKAEIGRSTLEMVPRQVAETFQVFPVMFDPQSRTLSIVTADPDDAEVIEQIRIQSGAKEVLAFVGRPAGVRAAIAKGYGGDIHAFAMLDRVAHAQFSAMLDVYERNVVSSTSMTTALAREATGERVVSERDMTEAQRRGASSAGAAIGQDEMLELLNVLVSLLETSRPDLRGHSAQTGRFVRRMLERINVARSSLAAVVAAAYLHDIGKMGSFHLTALNVSEYDGHKIAAQRAVSTPTRVIEAVHFPKETLEAIEQMYERYDGKGFPKSVAGKDISLGARVLAIADTYADLTQNPRNPYRKALMPAEACGVLAKYKDTIFDPHLVDLFKNMVMGEDIRAKLLSNRYYALLVDPDPEETTVLELRLIEQGFETKTARSAEQALKILAESPLDVVISEVDLPQSAGPADGLALLEEARKQSWGKDIRVDLPHTAPGSRRGPARVRSRRRGLRCQACSNGRVRGEGEGAPQPARRAHGSAWRVGIAARRWGCRSSCRCSSTGARPGTCASGRGPRRARSTSSMGRS